MSKPTAAIVAAPFIALFLVAASPMGRGGVAQSQAEFDELDTIAESLEEEYDDVEGWARLRRHDDTTSVRIKIRGLEPDTTYPAHLHIGNCDETLAGHYQHVEGGPVDDQNELWPTVVTDRRGHADITAKVPWGTRDGDLSVVIHHHAAGDDGKKAKVLCADV